MRQKLNKTRVTCDHCGLTRDQEHIGDELDLKDISGEHHWLGHRSEPHHFGNGESIVIALELCSHACRTHAPNIVARRIGEIYVRRNENEQSHD